MAAPRATQFIALRNLARGSHQVRHLHMTGPATYASPTLLKERPAVNLPRDIVALRAMCKQKGLDISGPKSALIARIEASELANSRAFSTAIKQSERPAVDQTSSSRKTTPYGTFEFTKPVRHFNTSRELKANNDSSTIDFAYLPSDILRPADVDVHSQIRVPIIPTLDASFWRKDVELEEVVVVMKPQINTVSADAVYLPFAEASDGHAMDIDFHALTDRMTANLRNIKRPVDQQAGIVKQIFSGMMDDIMGLKKLGTA